MQTWVFHLFSFQFMWANDFQLLQRDSTPITLFTVRAGRGPAGQHSWSQLKPTYSGLASVSPHTHHTHRLTQHSQRAFSWQTTAACERPPSPGPILRSAPNKELCVPGTSLLPAPPTCRGQPQSAVAMCCSSRSFETFALSCSTWGKLPTGASARLPRGPAPDTSSGDQQCRAGFLGQVLAAEEEQDETVETLK